MAATAYRTANAKSDFSVTSLFAAIAEWNDARMTRNALNKLTNRELEDIGLKRADIEAVATGTLVR